MRLLAPLPLSLLLVSFLMFLFFPARADQSPRQTIRLNDDWKFRLGDPEQAAEASFDDSSWRNVTIH